MKKNNKILTNEALEDPILKKSNPYKVPDDYFMDLKHDLKFGMADTNTRRHRIPVLIPAIAACAVLVIWASVLLYNPTASDLTNNPLITLVDEGYLNSSFIDNMYAEIDVDENFSEEINTGTLSAEASEYLKEAYLDNDYFYSNY
ncbi:MAG: hypothetical protein WC140_02845 [Bacteroidales bacterium]